ncbi:hypothetical protein GGX14DRAFT_546889 [Mycena pura]|uniref:Uncharacterized protein n=1 Tax=Mycena pura TaxID=153505 RepID=A0AAD6UR03_9AGAR|nr:hypothetical protein GGX14DRAFT_546889 [Mycena pura]
MAEGLDSSAALDVINTIEFNLYAAAVELFLYGVNVVLFSCYIHVLLTRPCVRHRALSIATTCLFFLCTVHSVLQIAYAILANRAQVELSYGGLVEHNSSYQASDAIRRGVNVLFVTNNVLADTIFIFRCYAVWNFRWKAIILPTILLLAGAILGYWNIALDLNSGYLLFYLSIGVSVLTNIVLVVLTAGRILWIARTARQTLPPDVTKRYYTISSMIVESGALLCSVAVLYLVLTYTEKMSTRIMCAALSQIAGIAPTIISVRVGLGRSVEGPNSSIAPLEFNTTARHSVEHYMVNLRFEDYVKSEGVMAV